MQRQVLVDEQKKRIDAGKQVNVTFLGDSTLDNRVWVDGLLTSYLSTRLGIKRDTPAVRVKKSHRTFCKPALSVVENVMDMLPDHIIHDYTNDGFTTKDVLQGEMKDKVFGQGAFSIFPNVLFCPLAEGEESIKKSQHIIVSVGGNNFRQFLKTAGDKKGEERPIYIRNNFNYVLKKMRDEYIEIVQRIRALNKDAQIILMTQYYPSASQNAYKIYPFMKEIGKILDLGGVFHDPMTVIHEIMKMTYSDVLKRIPRENIVVADITSSLNSFDHKNHVKQIEPSGLGGKKIAKMLKYIMTSDQVVPGRAYRFYPEFFTSNEQDQHVEGTDFDHWEPAHPWDLREGYSFEEEKVFRKYNADQLGPSALLQRLEQAMAKHDKTSPMYKAAQLVRDEAENLSYVMPEGNLKKWKMSVVLALDVLETPKTHDVERSVSPNFEHGGTGGAVDTTKVQLRAEVNPEYLKAVRLLKSNVDHRAIGKSDGWKKLKGALAMLAGAAIIGLSIAGTPFTGGASLTGFYVAGSLLSVGGAAFFYHNRQKSLAKESANLAKVANRQLTV